jgi:hypothetical protein
MHIITYKHEGVHHRCPFVTLSSAVNLIMRLREKNITFKHVFEE